MALPFLNRLTGFGAGGAKPVRARYVNQYSYTFSGTTASMTIPIADFQYPASPERQIVVFAHVDNFFNMTAISINGSNAPFLQTTGPGQGTVTVSAVLLATSNFNITLTAGSSETEVGRISVFEVENAAPIYESFGNCNIEDPYLLTIPIGGVAVAASMNPTDTATFTWNGGFTENVDADAGDFRESAASIVTPATAIQRLISTVTVSADFHYKNMLGIPPKVRPYVRGRCTSFNGSFEVDPMTVESFTIASVSTGRGNYKFIFTVLGNADQTITSVTYGGSAMTQIGLIRNTGPSPDVFIQVFAIDVVAGSPTGDVVIDWSAVPDGFMSYSAHALYGVGSVGTVASTSGNATGAAVSVNVSEGGCILAWHVRFDESQTITWTGVDEVDDRSAAFTARVGLAERYICTAESGRSVQAVGSASGQYATLAIPFNP